jgi:dTDP-4-amino-4,6-dideoxygalactose transaminase
MSEINAVMGLLQLKEVDAAICKRKEIDQRYRSAFEGIQGLQCMDLTGQSKPNFSYFPIIVGSEFPLSRDELYEKLKKENIYSRRYFYPLISDFPMYRDLPSSSSDNLKVAKKVASQVLCLPIYPDLTIHEQTRIIDAFKSVMY